MTPNRSPETQLHSQLLPVGRSAQGDACDCTFRSLFRAVHPGSPPSATSAGRSPRGKRNSPEYSLPRSPATFPVPCPTTLVSPFCNRQNFPRRQTSAPTPPQLSPPLREEI